MKRTYFGLVKRSNKDKNKSTESKRTLHLSNVCLVQVTGKLICARALQILCTGVPIWDWFLFHQHRHTQNLTLPSDICPSLFETGGLLALCNISWNTVSGAWKPCINSIAPSKGLIHHLSPTGLNAFHHLTSSQGWISPTVRMASDSCYFVSQKKL